MKVIQAEPFNENIFNIRMLYNLFSVYGNIQRMLYLKNSSSVLVEYCLSKCADQAIVKLNSLKYYETISVRYAKEQTIEFTDGLDEELLSFFEERFQGSEQFNRYKPKNSYVAAPPNETVFIMNLPDEQSAQYLLLEETKIVKYEFYPDAKKKHTCAIQFTSVEEAVTFLIKYHGLQMADRRILITFSKKPV